MWVSGDNAGGQLGIGSYESSDVPVQVKGLNKITQIAAHGIGFHSMAVRADGTLWSWEPPIPATKRSGIARFRWAIELVIGSPQALLNGKQITLDAPPKIVNNYTLVPVRLRITRRSSLLPMHSAQILQLETKIAIHDELSLVIVRIV